MIDERSSYENVARQLPFYDFNSKIYYETPVGKGKGKKPHYIDIVVVSPSIVYLVEVKRRLDPKALGQLLIYRDLFRLEFPHLSARRKILLVAAVESIDDTLVPTYHRFGIDIIPVTFNIGLP